MPRFSEIVLEHAREPRHWGRLKAPTAVGVAGRPAESRFAVFHLRVEGGRVVEVAFQAHGCGATIAAGSMLTELILDRSLEECAALTADELLNRLGGLPFDKRHCAPFVLRALQDALHSLGALTNGGPS